ncbi:MAG: hypothetical protein H6744_21635 [Deltaproteobacteria bacterium]|nr:hypothetical protein [Deltaproteobacteria bacterium]MCB9789287.1 hypothetical protein [Deltaproteobacteria bacterium]
MRQGAELPDEVWAAIASDLRRLHNRNHGGRATESREDLAGRVVEAAGLPNCIYYRWLLAEAPSHDKSVHECVRTGLEAVRAALDAEAKRPMRTPAEELQACLQTDGDIDETLARLSVAPTSYVHFVYRRLADGQATIDEAIAAFAIEQELDNPMDGWLPPGDSTAAPLPWSREFGDCFGEALRWRSDAEGFASSKGRHGLEFARLERDAKRAGPSSELWLRYIEALEGLQGPYKLLTALEQRLAAPARSTDRDELHLRLRYEQLRQALPWLAGQLDPVVAGPMNCGLSREAPPRVRFEYKCPKRWEMLELTDDAATRYCGGCGESVHYCDNESEVREHAARGDCIAVSARARDDVYKLEHSYYMGRPSVQTRVGDVLFRGE